MEWISVRDRLPEPGQRVIATNGTVSGEAYLGDCWKRYYGVGWQTAFDLPVTHWMPLPEPPKESPVIF